MSTFVDRYSMASTLELIRESAPNVVGFIKSCFDGIEAAAEGKKTYIGLVLVSIGIHQYFRQKYLFWRRRNVKTPTPIPFLGNFHSFFLRPREHLELEWPKKYGKVYGFYLGTRPYLVCSDADVLKKICIKDFDKFRNHYFVTVKNKYQRNFLIMLNDDHWRGMRAIISPTFASGRIRSMCKNFDDCSTKIISARRAEILEGGGSTKVNLRQMFGSLSMASAVSSFYGIDLSQGEGENTSEVFARNSREALRQSFVRFIISYLLPERLLKALNFPLFSDNQMRFLAEKARKIIEHRQNSGQSFNDYLHLLLEAKSDNKVESSEIDKFEEHHALAGINLDREPSRKSTKLRLSEQEVQCQTMMLMAVATETTATLLTNVFYLLAHHPEIQENLFRELQQLRRSEDQEGSGTFEYESLTSCIYLDCVVSESLRLMTPALYMDRLASEDYYIEKYDISIPKDTIIHLAYHAIHMDPDYWPEPEIFKPERFLPENKDKIVPGSYCPFGIGPRACIGFRFALTEVKVAIARLLTEFKFSQAPGTKCPPEPARITFILNEHKNLNVLMSERRSAGKNSS